MSTITDSQLQHQEVTSSQSLFSQQDDSQNTQSSAGLSQCQPLIEYVLTSNLTPEEFHQLKSQSQGTPCSANSLFVSQRSSEPATSKSSQKFSLDSDGKESQRKGQVFMGISQPSVASDLVHAQNRSPSNSLPESQRTGYFSNEATKDTSLFPSPITSQEDNSKTPTGSQNQPKTNAEETNEQMDDDETEVEDNQLMESDNAADKASDNEQENRTIGKISSTFNAGAFDLNGKSGSAFGGKPAFKQQQSHAFKQTNTDIYKGKQLNAFNGKQPVINCDKNQAMNYISIGKSNELISRMEACDGNYSQMNGPNYANQYPVKSIGKSQRNFGKYLDPHYQEPVAYGKQPPMEVHYIENEPAFDPSGFDAYASPNPYAGKGKFLLSQYPGKQQQFYGKQQANCKQMYQHPSKAMTNHETSTIERYKLTDLDGCQAPPNHGKSTGSNYRSSAGTDQHGSVLNLSRSSSPVSCDEMFNEDSNDSDLRKKRKNASGPPDDSHTMQITKVTKINDKSHEIRSLSQQFEGASLDQTPGEDSFDFYNQNNEYWKNNSSIKPAYIDSSNCSQPARFTKIIRTTRDSSSFENCLSSLDQSIETPRKSSAAYGPIQKPAAKTNKKSRGKKKSDEADLIKRAPVQKRLNISEGPKEPAKPSKPKSDRKASAAKESTPKAVAMKESAVNERPSRNASMRSTRGRVSSIGSLKSFASDDDDDASYTEDEEPKSKKDARRINNNKSARDYRIRQKEKETKLNAEIDELQEKYNKLRKELRKVLLQKHAFVKTAVEIGAATLPDWAQNIANLEEYFLTE